MHRISFAQATASAEILWTENFYIHSAEDRLAPARTKDSNAIVPISSPSSTRLAAHGTFDTPSRVEPLLRPDTFAANRRQRQLASRHAAAPVGHIRHKHGDGYFHSCPAAVTSVQELPANDKDFSDPRIYRALEDTAAEAQ